VKTYKTILRIIITFASMVGFLTGWATLAHSRKPIQPAQSQAQAFQPLQPLVPIQPFNSLTSNNNNGDLRVVTPSRRNRNFMPMFTTSGS
jgi:hypothetical protein